MRKISGSICLAASLCATPAFAALPAPARAMLDAAIASGNDGDIATVSKYLKQAYAGDADEIASAVAHHDAEVAAAKAAKEAEASHAGLLQNWKGQGQIGASQSSGNSSSTGVTAGISLTREDAHWRENVRVLANYQRTNGVTSANNLTAAFEPNYKFNRRLFVFGLAQYEKDRFQGFNSRGTLSGGLGYRVIDSSNMVLDFKAGPAWRHTRFIDGTSASHISGMAAVDYRWKISPGLSFMENASLLADSGDKTVTSLTALDAKLSGALSARLSYRVNYESDPAFGLKHTDSYSGLSLVYGF